MAGMLARVVMRCMKPIIQIYMLFSSLCKLLEFKVIATVVFEFQLVNLTVPPFLLDAP
jgi:hypothetical protein